VRSKAVKRVEAEFLGGGGKGSIDGASHFDRPAQMGKALGESEALGIGAAPLKSGVELKYSGGKRGRGHRFDSRGNKRVVTSRGRKKDFQFLEQVFQKRTLIPNWTELERGTPAWSPEKDGLIRPRSL